jgi:hypothetical protein
LTGAHGSRILLCATVVRDPIPAFSQVVGRMGLEPMTGGL